MKNIKVNIIPQLKDNYSYVLESENKSLAIIIDPAEADDHLIFLKKNNLDLHSIFLTHHHSDHTAGVEKIINEYPNITVYSPNQSIVGTTNIIKERDFISTPINNFEVIETPGHTLDHVILFDKKNLLLFSGDVLFRLGCGRVFEGTLKQMHESLKKINDLRDNFLVYCGHEYTLKNLLFLESVFKDSVELNKARIKIKQQISKNKYTIPFSLDDEKKINPFLNQKENFVLSYKENHNLTNFEMFKLLREKKDNF